MIRRMVFVALASCLACAPFAQADPCDSPWALDYRYQPGFSEFGVQGRTIDLAVFAPGQCVVVLGADDDSYWLRTYQVQPPALVALVDERREFDTPSAIEVSGGHVFVLDASGLAVYRLGGAGTMYKVGFTNLDGNPVALAVDGDQAWAGQGSLVSEIDISNPEQPMVVRTVVTPLVDSFYGEPAKLRARGREAWVIGRNNDILYVDGRGPDLAAHSVAPTGNMREKVVDIGWLADGRRAVAWRTSDGNLGAAGAMQFCEGNDAFLRVPLDQDVGTQCGSDVPGFGELPTPVVLTETENGVMYTGYAGGSYQVIQPAWSLYDAGSAPWPSDAAELWQKTYEAEWLGEMVVGRTDAGFVIEGPVDPAPNPVLSRINYTAPRGEGTVIAVDGHVIALRVPTGVQLVDASDPTAPVLAGLITVPGPAGISFVDGDPYLYGIQGNEVHAWDVSDLYSPHEVGTRVLAPGSVRMGSLDGATVIYSSANGSTTVEAWSPPGQMAEVLRVWNLSEPFAFRSVAGTVLGAALKWVDLDWPEPILPRSVYAPDSNPDWPWRWYAPYEPPPPVHRYAETVAYTGGTLPVQTVRLGEAPAEHLEQVYSRFDNDRFSIGNMRGDAIWTAQGDGVAVGWATGANAGSIDAFVTDFGEYFGFWWTEAIEIGEHFTAIGLESRLFLLAPSCRVPDPSVPIAVQAFEVDALPDGCARISFVASPGLALGLFRVVRGVAQELSAAEARSGLQVSQDCPKGPAVYELRDLEGVVHASSAFSPNSAARLRSRVVDVRPNPFNPSTEIRFMIADPGPVAVTIFDHRGRKVRTLFDGWRDAGEFVEVWNGTDDAGAPVAAGVYLVSLRASGVVDVEKMALVK